MLTKYKTLLEGKSPKNLAKVDMNLLQNMENVYVKKNSDARLAGKERIVKLLLCKAMWEAHNLLPPCVQEVIAILEAVEK